MAHPNEHPLFCRISHYINLINFIVLIVTGFMIHEPEPGTNMNLARNLHFIFMYLFLINGVARFYYSFFGKYKDYKEFLFNKNDISAFFGMIKYYLFLGKHPKTGKYNPLQKSAYIALPILSVLQAITGFILYLPEKLGSWTVYFGGLGAVRGIHYLFTWLFIMIILVHVYFVFTEAYDQFKLMFFGRSNEKKGTH